MRYRERMSNSPYSIALGAEIRTQIAVARLKHKDVARHIDVGASTLRRYLNGERDLTVPAYLDLCALLEIEPGLLLRRALDRVQTERNLNVSPPGLTLLSGETIDGSLDYAADTERPGDDPGEDY